MHFQELRQQVCEVNRLLFTSGLVKLQSGNASGLDAATGRIVIKPSGVDYLTLQPEMLVEVDIDDGEVVRGNLRPSVDLPHHLAIYREMPDVRGIVHTHSNFATAFAACHRPIPLCLTAMADEFGGEIPCTRFAECNDHELAESIFESCTEVPAILVANHGVFAWGDSPSSAFRAALMTEEAAKTVYLAMQIGTPQIISSQSADKYRDRYLHRYGQRPSSTESTDEELKGKVFTSDG